MMRIAKYFGIVTLAALPLAAQQNLQDQVDRAMADAQKAMDKIPKQQFEDVLKKLGQFQFDKIDVPLDFNVGALDDLNFKLGGLYAFAPQEAVDRAQEARERAQEMRDRTRALKDR